MLHKKMIRDIKNNLSQFITIFLMIMIGVMAYSGIKAYMDGMSYTKDTFYKENNIQDLNIIGTNFTNDDLNEIKNINGVNDAERKLSITGTTDNNKTLLINFIESNNISKFYVVSGKGFNKDTHGVWLDEYYANENNIKVGDYIKVKYDNISLKEKVIGLVNVPDHLYDVQDESELFPNRKEFGFAYLSINELTKDYSNYIIFNNIMVDLKDNANLNQVRNEIENKFSSNLAIIKTSDTTSDSTYQGEIDEGKTYVGVFSGLFIFIAMLSVIATMTRVIKKERTQIGTLKALGFKNSRILMHYIGYGLYISILASIVGLILGYFFIGNTFMNLETSVFEIPNGHPVINSSSYLVAILVVLLITFITYITGRTILKENPSETLRNKIPSVKGRSLNITKKGIFKKLNFSSKWNLRDIIRNKARTIMGIVGLSGSTMLIVCALGMLNSMNYFVDLQFNKLYNFDYKLNLMSNISENDLNNLENIYGNHTSRTYGIEIKDNNKLESNNIFVDDSDGYVKFIDNKDNYTKVDNNKGIYVTYKLASNNNYKIGDKITWHIYGDNHYYTSEIVGFNKDFQNQNITMTREYLESLGITYKPDSLYTNKDLKDVKSIKNVENIQDKDSLKNGMNNMLSMMKTMLTLIISIAIILGSIIIYNLGILSYTEKQYQFATLKVLGFDDSKIKNIFTKQNNWISIISILIGLPCGYILTSWLFKTAIDENYDFGAHILPITYILAAIGTFVISYLVSRLLAKRIKNIDMVTSLKGNE